MIEVLLNTPLAADLIRKGEVHELKPLMKRSTEQGMQTFDQALYQLYTQARSPTRTPWPTPTRPTTCA